MNAAKAISGKGGSRSGCAAVLLLVMGSLFIAGGGIGFWFAFAQPMLQLWNARSWPEAEARVLTSEVHVNHDSDGNTYRPEISYEYSVDGNRFRGDRYSFFVWSTSSRGWVERAVAKYSAGSRHPCFYDPGEPDKSVLDRGFYWSYLLGLLTLIFAAAGVLIAWLGVSSWGNTKREKQKLPAVPGEFRPQGLPSTHSAALAGSGGNPQIGPDSGAVIQPAETEPAPWLVWEGPRKLKPESTRLARVVGLGVFALFWNGFISIFVVLIMKDGWPLLPTLFISLFVLVGTGILAAFFHQFLALSNPIVEIALESGAVPVGGELVLAWETTGNAGRIRELRIEITGTEKATYTRGTDTTTDTHVFQRILAAAVTDPAGIRFGSHSVPIPATTMHTFAAKRNRIEWNIEVRGSIPWWPDVSEKYPFFVKPAEAEGEQP